MMKQTDDSLIKPSINEMTREEILSTFDRYKFRDEIGHDLLNCVHFQQLVDCAIRPRCNGNIEPQE